MGMEVMQQSSISLRQTNQVKARGDKDPAEEVVPEEAVTKDVAERANTSTAQNTHHQPGTSREKWIILSRFYRPRLIK